MQKNPISENNCYDCNVYIRKLEHYYKRIEPYEWSLMAILQSTTDMLVDQSISPISIRMQYWKLPEVSHQIDIG